MLRRILQHFAVESSVALSNYYINLNCQKDFFKYEIERLIIINSGEKGGGGGGGGGSEESERPLADTHTFIKKPSPQQNCQLLRSEGHTVS